MTENADAETALRDHLAETQPGIDHHIEPLEVGIEGWTFFRTEAVNVDDSVPSCAVVRDDGTVVTENPAEELGRVFQSLAVHDGDPPIRKLTEAARALLAKRTRPVYSENVERISSQYGVRSPEPPQVDYTDGSLVLTFLADAGGRRPVLNRYVVTVSPDYVIEWGHERIATMR